ncbi:LysR substrate-binding domain-containing protein, partial [Pantoea dispersa]
YCPERYVQAQLASGQLVRVLTDWCSEDEPLVMYYPDRRQLHPGLRRLIEMIRAETMR